MKSSGWAYFLAACGLVSPVAGIHRFYLGRPASAILYLFTWGFFGIGTILDLINMQRMVDDENRRLLYPGPPLQHRYLGAAPVAQLQLPAPDVPMKKLPLEQQILKVASEHQGAVTVAMVAVETGVSMREAKIYVFEGLGSNKKLELE
jgi:hypothetical protein